MSEFEARTGGGRGQTKSVGSKAKVRPSLAIVCVVLTKLRRSGTEFGRVWPNSDRCWPTWAKCRIFGHREGRQGHSEIRFVAPCRHLQFSPNSARGNRCSQRCGPQTPDVRRIADHPLGSSNAVGPHRRFPTISLCYSWALAASKFHDFRKHRNSQTSNSFPLLKYSIWLDRAFLSLVPWLSDARRHGRGQHFKQWRGCSSTYSSCALLAPIGVEMYRDVV